MVFENLNIIEPILQALKSEGYTEPTPIQEQAIPPLLLGRDLLGCAQTGTGKTAAFVIPILQTLLKAQAGRVGKKPISALILTPTRELAAQIAQSCATYGQHLTLKSFAIYGGVSQNPQTDAIRRGIDILIATPGRLLDLMQQRLINLSAVELFVLDEADHMLDMGFINDVKKIIAAIPTKRQTMLFSATMPAEINKLASSILIDPVRVSLSPVTATADKVEQAIYYVNRIDKKKLLPYILNDQSVSSALVFSRTKHGADKIAKELIKDGIRAEAIHGNKSQQARQLALQNFKTKKIKVLVATDIAARGIDIEELSHVINYDLPEVPETYVHRIGRTGRAGLGGIAVSFCDQEEKKLLRDIQKLISRTIQVIDDHPYPLLAVEPAALAPVYEIPPRRNTRNFNRRNNNR